MKIILLLITISLVGCASNIPELDTLKYANRLALIHMKCQRKNIRFITLVDDKLSDLNQCKFIDSIKKHNSTNESPCPDLFQHLVKDGANKVVLAPAESPFIMELRKLEKVDVYQCPEPLYKAFVQTEKKLHKL